MIDQFSGAGCQSASARRRESLTANNPLASLGEKLRNQLKNFAVRDTEGKLVGVVRDLYLAADNQLNLLVSKPAPHPGGRLFILKSQIIRKIDYCIQSLFINLSAAQIEQLLEYLLSKRGGVASVSGCDSILLSELPHPPETPVPAATAHPQPAEDGHSAIERRQPEDVPEKAIPLLEERSVVERDKHSAGELLTPNKIESRMGEFPARREKRIIEQIRPDSCNIAGSDTGDGELAGVELRETTVKHPPLSATGEFTSAETATRILNAIARHRGDKFVRVRVEILLDNSQLQKTYQEWFDRYSDS